MAGFVRTSGTEAMCGTAYLLAVGSGEGRGSRRPLPAGLPRAAGQIPHGRLRPHFRHGQQVGRATQQGHARRSTGRTDKNPELWRVRLRAKANRLRNATTSVRLPVQRPAFAVFAAEQGVGSGVVRHAAGGAVVFDPRPTPRTQHKQRPQPPKNRQPRHAGTGIAVGSPLNKWFRGFRKTVVFRRI